MSPNDKSLRLIPLLSAAPASLPEKDASISLIQICIEKSIEAYVRVPPGLEVVSYAHVIKETRPGLSGVSNHRPRLKLHPEVSHQISLLRLDASDLLQLRDTGEAEIEEFMNGGLVSHEAGLVPVSLKYGVLQKVSPLAHSAGGVRQRPVRVLEGQVYPRRVRIQIEDVLVSTSDEAALRTLVGAASVTDKWGHAESAPSVFLAYQISQEPYDFETAKTALVNRDKHDVYIDAIAETVARLMKVGVRPIAERGFALGYIAKNPLGKDYSDPALSKRMSLLLLATDCWIHDSRLQTESDDRLRPIRDAAAPDPRKHLTDLAAARKRLQKAGIEEGEKLKNTLYMPAGLRAFLEQLGFSGSQADQLSRIITHSKPGGRHVATEKIAKQAGVTKERLD